MRDFVIGSGSLLLAIYLGGSLGDMRLEWQVQHLASERIEPTLPPTGIVHIPSPIR